MLESLKIVVVWTHLPAKALDISPVVFYGAVSSVFLMLYFISRQISRWKVGKSSCYWNIERLEALHPLRLEKLVTALFAEMGYRTNHTPNNGGIDVIAQKVAFGRVPIGRPIGIQVKRYTGAHKVTVDIIRQAAAIAIDPTNCCQSAIIVTTSSLTGPARRSSARFRTIKRVIEGEQLVYLICRFIPHYEDEKLQQRLITFRKIWSYLSILVVLMAFVLAILHLLVSI